MKNLIAAILLIALTIAGIRVYDTLKNAGYDYSREKGLTKTETVFSVRSPFSEKTYSIENNRNTDIFECINYVLDLRKGES